MRRLIPSVIAFGLAAVVCLSGATNLLERQLMDQRFELARRPATGSIVVVAIDPKSLRELDRWPWPRTLHAEMIRRLVAAGARRIALDIDFSSRSAPADDAALAHAIAAAGNRIVLPVFRQHSAHGSPDGSATPLTRPMSHIGATARLASVTVRPDPDGLVRRERVAERVDGRLYPSLAAALAGTAHTEGAYYIDYGIAPDTIPVLSYADVLHGRFDRAAIAGKRVIVGATAVELGDRLAVPLYRSLPGPVVQALSYESLVQGRAIHTVRRWAVLALSLLVALGLGPCFARHSWRWGAAAVVVVTTAAFATSVAIQAVWPVSLAVTPIILTALFAFGANVIGEVERQARELFAQGIEVLSKGAMLRGVIEDSFDGIVITDAAGTVELFNDAAARMLGCAPAEAIGRPIAELLPLPFALEAIAAGDDDATARLAAPREIDIAAPDGATLPVELVVSTSVARTIRRRRGGAEAQRRILIFTFRDVSERRRAMAAQVAATEEAMAANRAKSEFLTNMSHELRTPLNAIIGFSEMLTAQLFGPLGDPRYVDYASDIHASGAHLRDLVNDILDVSKIEAGKLELNEETVDAAGLADASVRMVRSRAEARGVALVLDGPPAARELLIVADERLVKQSLLNLLSNAVKFTPEGGNVTVTVAAAADGGVAIGVRDTGIGIEAEDLPHLTDPFYQVDGSLARTHEGTGLGLYLVSRFMALHDGTLDIESEPGAGTSVILRFPARRTVTATRAAVA